MQCLQNKELKLISSNNKHLHVQCMWIIILITKPVVKTVGIQIIINCYKFIVIIIGNINFIIITVNARDRVKKTAVCGCNIVAERRRGCGKISHKQLHEAVVLLNVAFENLLTGAEHSLKTRAVELGAAERALGLDGGCARSLQQ